MIASRLRITGRVQGVGFRDWLIAEAARLGLVGWVRNVGTDTVEALICGSRDAVDECLRACRRGPAMAVVESITEEIAEPPEEPGFVRRGSLPHRP